MHRRHCLLLILLLGVYVTQAQYFKISGKIANDKLEPLALVSIQVKGSVKGTISKEDLNLVLFTDDIHEAMDHIGKYITTNYKVKPRRKMWWLFEKK